MISKSFFMANTCTTHDYNQFLPFPGYGLIVIKTFLGGQLATETTHFLNDQIVAKFAKI